MLQIRIRATFVNGVFADGQKPEIEMSIHLHLDEYITTSLSGIWLTAHVYKIAE